MDGCLNLIAPVAIPFKLYIQLHFKSNCVPRFVNYLNANNELAEFPNCEMIPAFFSKSLKIECWLSYNSKMISSLYDLCVDSKRKNRLVMCCFSSREMWIILFVSTCQIENSRKKKMKKRLERFEGDEMERIVKRWALRLNTCTTNRRKVEKGEEGKNHKSWWHVGLAMPVTLPVAFRTHVFVFLFLSTVFSFAHILFGRLATISVCWFYPFIFWPLYSFLLCDWLQWKNSAPSEVNLDNWHILKGELQLFYSLWH